MAKLAMVHIVGSQATIAAMMAYTNRLGPAFIELITFRAPLTLRQSMIETHTVLMNKAGLERERFVAMTQQYTLDGVRDRQKLSAIDAQYQIAMGNSRRRQIQPDWPDAIAPNANLHTTSGSIMLRSIYCCGRRSGDFRSSRGRHARERPITHDQGERISRRTKSG